MPPLWSLLGFGFWLGVRHAADPDHVVAVSTIVARTRKLGTAWLLGAFWGAGHMATVCLVGAALILLRITIPPRVGLALELAVAAALIFLGLLNMAGYGLASLGLKRHSHPHSHDDPEHRHQFLDAPGGGHRHDHAHLREVKLGWLKSLLRDAGAFQLLRSAAVGLVHGLAGSAAAALLVLGVIPEPRWAALYLLVFGAGTVAGMLLLSALMELSMVLLARWWGLAEKLLTFSTGLLSCLFGLYLAYQIAVVDGLLIGEPRWSPH